MESSSYWLLFFSAALAINISPGPDMIYIVSRTIAQGKKVGMASSLGVCCGALVHVFAAAIGLSAILATAALAFALVKYIGAAYLIYLGIKSLRSRGISFDMPIRKQPRISGWQAFRQGALVDVLNPKVAVFFMAFLPQFIRPELGHSSLQILVLGVLVILVAVVVEAGIVLTAARTTMFFRNNPRLSVWLDRFLGSVLIGLGLRLALLDDSSH